MESLTSNNSNNIKVVCVSKKGQNRREKTAEKPRERIVISPEEKRRLEEIKEQYGRDEKFEHRVLHALAQFTLHVYEWRGLYVCDPGTPFKDTPAMQLAECDYVWNALADFVPDWQHCADERAERYPSCFVSTLKFLIETLESIFDDIYLSFDDYVVPNHNFFGDMRWMLENPVAKVQPDEEWQVLAFGLELIEWRAHDCTEYPRDNWLFEGMPETQANRWEAREKWLKNLTTADYDIPIYRELYDFSELTYQDKEFSQKPFAEQENIVLAALCLNTTVSYLSEDWNDPDDGVEVRQYISILLEKQRQFAIKAIFDYCESRAKASLIADGRRLWMQAVSTLPNLPDVYQEHVAEVPPMTSEQAMAFINSIQELSRQEWVERKTLDKSLSIDCQKPKPTRSSKEAPTKSTQNTEGVSITNCQNVQIVNGDGNNIQRSDQSTVCNHRSDEPQRWSIFKWLMTILGTIIAALKGKINA